MKKVWPVTEPSPEPWTIRIDGGSIVGMARSRAGGLAAILAVCGAAAITAAASTAGSRPASANGVIAFTSNRFPDRDGELYAVGVGGGPARDLSRSPSFDSDPVVSKDGRTLAFFSGRGDGLALWSSGATARSCAG